MLKVARFVPRVHFGGIFAQNVRHCSNKDATIEPPIEPLQMSYNSHENLTGDPNTPPVIIMHGLLIPIQTHLVRSIQRNNYLLLIHSQVYSVQNKIGGALAKPFIQKLIQRGTLLLSMHEIMEKVRIRLDIVMLIWLKTYICFARSIKSQKPFSLDIAWVVEQ